MLPVGIFLRTFLVLVWIDLAVGDEVVSIGKLRASADVAMSAGKNDEALKLWAKVIEMEPKNEQNFYKRFRVFLRAQKLKEALGDLNTALSINPKFEQVIVQRGKLQMRLGRCEEATRDFQILRSLNPNNKDLISQNDAAKCHHAMKEGEAAFSRGQWMVAKDHFTDAIAYAENAPALFLRRAWCYHYTGDLYESIADTGKAQIGKRQHQRHRASREQLLPARRVGPRNEPLPAGAQARPRTQGLQGALQIAKEDTRVPHEGRVRYGEGRLQRRGVPSAEPHWRGPRPPHHRPEGVLGPGDGVLEDEEV